MILIDIINKQDINGYFYYYKENFANLIQSHKTKVILVFLKQPVYIYTKELEKITQTGTQLYEYSTLDELTILLGKHQQEDELFINTFYEEHILLKNKIEQILNIPTTDNPLLFRDKSLQRKALKSNFPESTPKSQVIDTIYSELQLNFPFIAKPLISTSSKGAQKIKNKEHWDILLTSITTQNKYIIEEYITGNFYNLNYFVDSDQNIIRGPLVRNHTGEDLGVDDFGLTYKVLYTYSIDFDEKLTNFLKQTVKAFGLRNTFIDHEFKINGDEIKTIEINGRIGGFRLEMQKLGFQSNILSYIYKDKNNIQLPTNKTNNVCVFKLYPHKTGQLKQINKTLIYKVRELHSFHRDNIFRNNEMKMIGLAKDGYESCGTIVIAHTDHQQFQRDFMFIKDNYYNFLEIGK